MSSENIATKARGIITADRSADIRSVADSLNTHCVYASIYQTALALATANPLRQPEIEAKFAEAPKDGHVPPTQFFDILLQLNRQLRLQIREIYTNPSFIAHFGVLPDEMVPEKSSGKHNKKSKTKDHSHAEFFDGSPIHDARIKELHNQGWSDTMVILLEPANVTVQTIADIPNLTHLVTGQLDNIPFPFIRILVKMK